MSRLLYQTNKNNLDKIIKDISSLGYSSIYLTLGKGSLVKYENNKLEVLEDSLVLIISYLFPQDLEYIFNNYSSQEIEIKDLEDKDINNINIYRLNQTKNIHNYLKNESNFSTYVILYKINDIYHPIIITGDKNGMNKKFENFGIKFL
ncbi:hypothetical protein YN1_5270 [Nanoarchaeota archaeon]